MNLLNILLHEMIHAHLLNTDPNSCVLNGGHGTAFREKAREIMEAEVDDSRVMCCSLQKSIFCLMQTSAPEEGTRPIAVADQCML